MKHTIRITNTLYKIHSKLLDTDIEFYDTLDECVERFNSRLNRLSIEENYIDRIETIEYDGKIQQVKTTFKLYE